MRKATPKIRLYLAQQVLEQYYKGNDEPSEAQKVWMNKLYGNNPESKGIRKLRMRLLDRECSEIIVGAVIADATQEEKIFLRDKYKLRCNFTAISCKLHVHVNGLQRWRDRFLNEIAQMLNYELPERDVWSYRKVGALIKVLERNIDFLEQNDEETDKESLKRLCGLRDRYRILHAGMEKYLFSEDDSTRTRIVRERLLHVELGAAELADFVGYSHTTVGLCLAEFLKKYYYRSAVVGSPVMKRSDCDKDLVCVE